MLPHTQTSIDTPLEKAASIKDTPIFHGSSAPDQQQPPFTLPVSFSQSELHDFLRVCATLGVSDLTIQSGDYIWGEWRRVHTRMTDRRLEHNEVERTIRYMYGSTGVSQLISGEATDFEYEISANDNDYQDVIRFRCNATASRVGGIADGASITMRAIAGLPLPWEALKLPKDIHNNFFPQYGLVLVIGTTGSGKSTLLSAGNRFRLEQSEKPVKIITYEEPIESVYTGLAGGRMPQPSQVHIGRHLKSFQEAGRNAMRRKADVIVMGESRDVESVSACFEMALSGHAVYSTLHADTPAECFARMVSFFPEDSQPAAANKLLGTTRLIVAQKLARCVDGSVVAIQSWLVIDREVSRIFSENPFYQWGSITTKILAHRKTDFESQALPLFEKGELSFSTFREIVNMTIAELVLFLKQKGLERLIPNDPSAI